MSFRCERTEEQIRRQVSLIIRNLKNVSLASKEVGVVSVSINKDCSNSKIYISSIKGIGYAKSAACCLNRASGHIKHEISKNLKLKKVPNIEFIADDSLIEARRLEELFSKIKTERI